MKPSLKTARARTEVKNIRANIGLWKEWKKQGYTPVYVQAQQLVEVFVSTGREKKVEAKVTERPELFGAQNWQ